MKLSHHYTLEDAEEIKKAYSSWIGKKAHIGGGSHKVLQEIVIRVSKNDNSSERSYTVEFRFDDNRVFGAYEFGINNGLVPVNGIRSASDQLA
jgi:hypothetical protein